ncbi:MAG: hypothetical protein IJ837_02875 [Clostridia bacterium]|nr:hypothetical protein [Clostridia bacterium]
MIVIDLTNITTTISSIMNIVLIVTIVLGCVFALIGIVFIVKRIRYSIQVRHNKKEYEKILKEHKALEN